MCSHALVNVGTPQQVIECLACDEEITLIVMPVLENAALGPVTEHLLRESTRPLLALRPASVEDPERFRGTCDRAILVPLDGSEASRRSLPLAMELAASLEARLILMRVMEGVSGRIDAVKDLRDLAERLNGQGTTAEILVEIGDPVERILHACLEPAVQLVAMATQGRSGTSEGLLGSVTRKLLSRSPVPVLAVHVRG
jgi:nucleotide-binding universal stress UspA family protein